jgi:phosphoribosyl 1,2-cyclic phosphodiesterase
VANLGVNIYASRGTLDALNVSGHRYKELKPCETFSIGTLDVMAFDVVHDAAEPVGYFIGSKVTRDKLVYFVDTAFVKYKFTDITHIIAECNYCADTLQASVDAGITPPEMVPRLLKSHMSLETLIGLLKANDLSKLRAIYLAHLSDERSDAEKMKVAVQRETGVEVYVC